LLDLPIPHLGSLTASKTAKTEEHAPSKETAPVPAKPVSQRTEPVPQSTPPRTNTRKPSFGLDADPWASPDLHRGHNHTTNGAPPHPNGSSTTASLPQRTTSAFTTSSNRQDATSERRTSTRPPGGGDQGWGAFTGSSTDSFRDSGLGGGGGFAGGDPPGSNDPTGQGRPIVSAPRPVAPGVDEVITITSISEKEGMMFFQHRNYEVTSARRNSKVIRRYSDFVWLLDCLHKRYPFRQLPLLPPKRVASKFYSSSLLAQPSLGLGQRHKAKLR
jgi:sorting nexin-8